MFYLRKNITDLVKILRELSEPKKKVVIFFVVIVVGIILSFFWVKSAAQSISKFPAVNLPTIDIPDFNIETPVVAIEDDKNADLPAKVMPTADWQTYANAQYGFEVKYPKDWQQKDFNTKAQELLGFCPMADELCKGQNIYVVIYKDPYTVKDESDYYLGKSEVTGFYYYLYNSSSENKEVFENMVASFKFINTTK